MDNNNKWDELSLTEKSEVMRQAVANGITDLNEIRQTYNKYADGGSMDEPEGTVTENRKAVESAKNKYPMLANLDFSVYSDPNYRASDYDGYGDIEVFYKGEQKIDYTPEYSYHNPNINQDNVLYNPDRIPERYTQDAINLDAISHLGHNDPTYDALNATIGNEYPDAATSEMLPLYEKMTGKNLMKMPDSKRPTKNKWIPQVLEAWDDAPQRYQNAIDGLVRDYIISKEHPNPNDPIYKGLNYVKYNPQWDSENNSPFYLNQLYDYITTGRRPANILPEVIVTGHKHAGGGKMYDDGGVTSSNGSYHVNPADYWAVLDSVKNNRPVEVTLPDVTVKAADPKNYRSSYDPNGFMDFIFAHAYGGDIHTTGGAGYVPSVSPSFISNTVEGLKEVSNNFTLNPNTQRYRFYKYFDPYAAYDNTSVNRAINLFIGGPNYAKNQYFKDRKKEGISYRSAKESYREGAASSFDDAVWGTYLGIPKNKRKFKSSLVESKYRPTKGNNDETYYTIPIVNKTKDELVKEAESLNIGENKNTQALFGYNMGTSTLGKGYDDRGEYVSYYDKWDINPFHGAFSSYNLKDKHPLLYKVLPKDGSDFFMGFTNPVNFYDRIYLDDYYGLKEPSHATYLPEVVVRPNNNALSKLLYADGGPLDTTLNEVTDNQHIFKDGGEYGNGGKKNKYSFMDKLKMSMMNTIPLIPDPTTFNAPFDNVTGNVNDRTSSVAQVSYLLPRDKQQKLFEDYGYKRVYNDYGTVKRAAESKGYPIYQKNSDDASRENLVPIGNADSDPFEVETTYKGKLMEVPTNWYAAPNKSLIEAGATRSTIYYNPDNGKYYQKAWDLNDYGGNGGSTAGIFGKFLDTIGNPVVVTSGIQEVLPENINKVEKNYMLPYAKKHYLKKADNGHWEYVAPDVIIYGHKHAEGGFGDGGPLESPTPTPLPWEESILYNPQLPIEIPTEQPVIAADGGYLFKDGGYIPSASIKRDIANFEGSSMKTNRSFEVEAKDFNRVIPLAIRNKLSQRQLDALYSYGYNVGMGNLKNRVLPTLTAYTQGRAGAEDVAASMWASKDMYMRGLQRRRTYERNMFTGNSPVGTRESIVSRAINMDLSSLPTVAKFSGDTPNLQYNFPPNPTNYGTPIDWSTPKKKVETPTITPKEDNNGLGLLALINQIYDSPKQEPLATYTPQKDNSMFIVNAPSSSKNDTLLDNMWFSKGDYLYNDRGSSLLFNSDKYLN